MENLFNASGCELVRIACESSTGGSRVSEKWIRNVVLKSLVKHLGLLTLEKQLIVFLLDLTFFAHNARNQLSGVPMLFSPYLIPDLGKLLLSLHLCSLLILDV